ncbi:LysM-like peptidoglycan-binding domain-containing protein [Vibrio sp. YMD68]|uniref:LysM-like peptidoglycan-binding domain-containing protein n=1 Tax=Vibrio sp. YMD68 TaxID=3042300 RepID=UPI002499DADB|nr:LysM-like peptidoglycan-binding domain-containing protein [Vibrio sp. YMD68]WGW00633.1 LysM-like peptidoglycan-binding domain-containing protein [Vibrio sp. YMD68]
MNRRKKKPQSTNYLGLVLTQLKSIEWHRYVQTLRTLWLQLPKLHQRALTVLIPGLIILLLLPSVAIKETVKTPTKERVEIAINTQGLSAQSGQKSSSPDSEVWNEYTVKTGDTLAKVFRINELPMSDLNALVEIEGGDKPLSRIKQGQLVRFKLSEDGRLDILQLSKSKDSVMFFRLSDGGFGRSK